MIRKKLKEDKFAELMTSAFSFITKRWKLILRIVFGIVVVVGVVLLINLRMKERELSAMRLLDKGEVVFRESKLSDAKAIFEEVRRNFPNSKAGGAALIYIGESSCLLGELDEAEEVFNEYLAKHGEGEFSARAQEGLGHVMEERGKFREAIDAYRKICENYPDSFLCPQAILSIARCYGAIKEWAEAKKAYEELLSLYPWSSSATLAQAYLDIVEFEVTQD